MRSDSLVLRIHHSLYTWKKDPGQLLNNSCFLMDMIVDVPRIRHLCAMISRIFPGLVDSNRVPLNPPGYADDDARSPCVV